MSKSIRGIADDPTSFTPTHTFDEYANSTKDGHSGEYLSVVRAVTYLHGSMEDFAEESEQEVQVHADNIGGC